MFSLHGNTPGEENPNSEVEIVAFVHVYMKMAGLNSHAV
jgi:hypothetical protein